MFMKSHEHVINLIGSDGKSSIKMPQAEKYVKSDIILVWGYDGMIMVRRYEVYFDWILFDDILNREIRTIILKVIEQYVTGFLKFEKDSEKVLLFLLLNALRTGKINLDSKYFPNSKGEPFLPANKRLTN